MTRLGFALLIVVACATLMPTSISSQPTSQEPVRLNPPGPVIAIDVGERQVDQGYDHPQYRDLPAGPDNSRPLKAEFTASAYPAVTWIVVRLSGVRTDGVHFDNQVVDCKIMLDGNLKDHPVAVFKDGWVPEATLVLPVFDPGPHTITVKYRFTGGRKVTFGHRSLTAYETADARKDLHTTVHKTGEELDQIRKEVKELRAQCVQMREALHLLSTKEVREQRKSGQTR